MNPYLIRPLEYGPRIIAGWSSRRPRAGSTSRLGPGRFSVREVVAHLADWEPILRGRIRAANEQPGVAIVGEDEGQRAIDMNYAGSDVREQLALWTRERGLTIEFLRTLGQGIGRRR